MWPVGTPHAERWGRRARGRGGGVFVWGAQHAMDWSRAESRSERWTASRHCARSYSAIVQWIVACRAERLEPSMFAFLLHASRACLGALWRGPVVAEGRQGAGRLLGTQLCGAHRSAFQCYAYPGLPNSGGCLGASQVLCSPGGCVSYLAVFSEKLHVCGGQRGAEQCSCMSPGYWLLVACHQDNLMRTCAHTVCPNNSSFPGCSVHVVVATPGRILDLAGKGVAKLQSCKMMAMDEVSLSLGWRSKSCV